MKNSIYLALTLIVMAGILGCEEEDLPNGGDPVIYYVRVTEPNSSDSLLVRAYEGATIAIIGDNLGKTNQIMFNDRKAELLPVYVTNTTILVRVPEAQPVEVDNKMKLHFSDGKELLYDFESYRYPEDSILSPLPVAVGEELTIIGTNLDIVAGLLFPNMEDPVTSFVSQSASELKVIVPEGAGNGFMQFVTIHGVWTDVTTKLQLPTLDPLEYALFDDEIESTWGNWSWGGAVDLASAEMIFNGSTSIKKVHDSSWDALSFGGSSVSVGDYEYFVMYAYGGDEITGFENLPGETTIQLIVNEAWTSDPITVLEGEWADIEIPIADVGIDTWTRITIQGRGTSGTIYYDYIGFR